LVLEGIELHLDEQAALDFISYVRKWRKNVNEALKEINEEDERQERGLFSGNPNLKSEGLLG